MRQLNRNRHDGPGEYQHLADTATLDECLTGLKLDVAPEADYATLETAYEKARTEPGQRVLVNVETRPDPGYA